MNGKAAGPPGDGWRAAAPEIWIAVAVAAVAAVAAYAAAGPAGAALAVTCAAVAALVVLRFLAPRENSNAAAGAGPPADTEAIPGTFSGYWRKRAGLTDGTRSMAAYDAELRGTLQHLLAARLAERHGVSLHEDPEAARRLLCQGRRDERLWYWVDPARPPTARGAEGRRAARRQPGIPPRTLARLIDRLEQL
jgi:hypothetical protein